jgi:L-threonylcarbamoyladenylate synthase
LLRPGLVTVEQIETLIGPILRFAPAVTDQPLASPGMLPRHYSPRAPLEIAMDDGRSRVIERARNEEKIGWITWPDVEDVPNVIRINLPREPIGYAAGLYAALHQLDAAGVQRIFVSRPPDTDDWLAIRDRLSRASRNPRE